MDAAPVNSDNRKRIKARAEFPQIEDVSVDKRDHSSASVRQQPGA
ncbi:MAG TPA: hypothetical protein VFX51_11465 [Solirubrobacteraceae bacterium]|nr:hypothetical protein [Solirubrobacteraceae bacterium]